MLRRAIEQPAPAASLCSAAADGAFALLLSSASPYTFQQDQRSANTMAHYSSISMIVNINIVIAQGHCVGYKKHCSFSWALMSFQMRLLVEINS